MEADLNEFPWLVLLEYRKWGGSDLTTNCAGSLINHRYVLTAAHCLKGKNVRNIGKLASVRLGEHDTSTDVDCSVGGGKCAKKFQRMGIEKIVAHELYTRMHHNMYNDIGLIRLDQNVIYSESIQPICLPRAVGWAQRYSGQPLTVAGWGKTENKDRSPTKQKVVIGYVLFKECRRTYPWITLSQMCAGEHSEKDSCAGDSGGPLMHFRNGVGFLEGIVSFGYGCGIKDVPGVYTDVYAYDSWIRDNVRAGEGEYVDIIVEESVEDNNIYPLN